MSSSTTASAGAVDAVREYDAGLIRIYGTVENNARELGDGDLDVRASATVLGNVVESEAGDVILYSGADIRGEVLQTGPGTIVTR